MASAGVTRKKPCAKCDKGAGIFTCDGCQQSFCRKHSDEHRQELAVQMDSIGQEYNVLQRDFDKDTTEHPLLAHINTWEQESIDRIQQVARDARVDLEQILTRRKQELRSTMSKLTNQLQTSRDSEDYTEFDLKKWIERMSELHQTLEQSMNIWVTEDQDPRSLIRFIKVTNLAASRSTLQSIPTTNLDSGVNTHSMKIRNERFNNGDDSVKITEEGQVITLSQWTFHRAAVIFGRNTYFQNDHCLRFIIESKNSDHFFFGVVTASHPNVATVLKSNSGVYGWWPSHFILQNGVVQKNYHKVDIQDGDELTMTLRCDQSRIYFEHPRTKTVFDLPVDSQKCPFPWKLVVGLIGNGNSVRIIQ